MKNYILYILLAFSFAVSAQEKDKTLPKANDEYSEKKFVEAEANYRISRSKFPKRTVAPFNLGNSIYKQNQIGAVMLLTGTSHYAVFFAYMKYIVADIFPVDVLKRKTLFVAIYTLLQCLTQSEQVVCFFTCSNVAFVHGKVF